MSILSKKRLDANDAAAARKAGGERRIAAATAELLSEGRSFAEITVGEIAERAGIARSAFYTHFADKRALILRLAQEAAQPLASYVQALDASGDPDPMSRMKDLLHVAAAPYKDTPHIARALFEAASYDRVVREWWDRHIDAMLALVILRAEQERAAGTPTLEGLDLRTAVYTLHWMIHETLNQELIQHRRFEYDDVIDTIVALVTRAVDARA